MSLSFGLSRLAFLISAGLKPASTASPLPPLSGPNASAPTYESLMLLWARAGSTRRCLEAQARQPPRWLPLGPFWTIGVEGSGHHLIEAMHPILCNGARLQERVHSRRSRPQALWRAVFLPIRVRVAPESDYQPGLKAEELREPTGGRRGQQVYLRAARPRRCHNLHSRALLESQGDEE